MRIDYVINARFPTEKAHGVHVAENICEFARQGVEVNLVVPDRRIWKLGFQGNRVSFDYYGLPECAKVTRLWTLDFVDFFKPVGFYIERLTFAVSAFLYLSDRDSIVYGRDELVFALIKLFYPNRKVFYELHDYPESFLFFWRWLFGELDGIISTNEWKRRELINKFGVPESKVIVARNGIRLEDFEIKASRSELNLPEGKIIVGYAGGFRTKGAVKGVESIAQAVEMVKKNYPDVLLKILNGIPHKMMPSYLKCFDILLMPFPDTPHYAHYMSPLKMFEYMAAGRAIVTTDLPSIREVLDESSARFVRSHLPKDLREGIEELVADEQKREQLGRNARKGAEAHTLAKRVSLIINFIKSNV